MTLLLTQSHHTSEKKPGFLNWSARILIRVRPQKLMKKDSISIFFLAFKTVQITAQKSNFILLVYSIKL